MFPKKYFVQMASILDHFSETIALFRSLESPDLVSVDLDVAALALTIDGLWMKPNESQLMEPTVCCVPPLMIWDVPEDPIGDEKKPERFVLGLVDVEILASEYWELEEALAVVPAAGHQFLEELVLMILSELWIGNGVGNLVLDGQTLAHMEVS